MGVTYTDFHLNLNNQLDLAYQKLYGKNRNIRESKIGEPKRNRKTN